jgi:basic membrane protein A and related proteins
MGKSHRPLAVGLLLLATAFTAWPAAADDLSAAFIYSGPVGSPGWTNQQDLGRQCLAADGIKTAFVDKVPENADVLPVERDFLGQGYNVIFADGFGYQPFTQQLAKQNPDKFFIGIAPNIAPAANILDLYGKLWDGRYLTGLVAGAMTKTNTIGFVAAQPIPTVIAGINAFTLGARAVNPKAQVKVLWTLSWFDPPAEKQAAVSLVQAGADVVAQHQDSPASVEGAAQAGAWAIGSEADQTSFAPDKYLTGTVWNWCPLYRGVIASIRSHSFKDGTKFGGLGDGTVVLAPLNKAVPEPTRELVKKRQAEIVAGSFDYWKGPIKDNTGKVVIPEGKTIAGPADIGKINWLIEGVIGSIPKHK